MASGQHNWTFIVNDLARHLRTSATVQEARAILDQAERDIALLAPPCDFWKQLEREVVRIGRCAGDEMAAAGSSAKVSMVRDLILTKVGA